MAASPRLIRRISGTVFLGTSVVMLILGVTVLDSRLEGRTFVWYWLACFVCLWMALMAAWLDIRAIRQEARAAQRELIREVLSEDDERDDEDQSDGNAAPNR